MQSTLQNSAAPVFQVTQAHASLWKKFINWADGQEKNRLGWTAFAIAGHGCVFTIVTIAMILFTGNNFIFWPFAIAAMGTPLIVNLAALPSRITIPVLFFSVLVDVAIIVLCLMHGFDVAGTYV